MKYFNRDLSWLSFNHRVLQEAGDESVPLFERLKFLAIFSSNLEEFFRVRVASLRSLISLKKKEVKELDFNPEKLLEEIHLKVEMLQTEFGKIFRDKIIPGLRKHDIQIKSDSELDERELDFIQEYFSINILPYIVPVILIKKKVKPFLRTGILYLAIAMTSGTHRSKKSRCSYGLVEIPTEKLPRFVVIPGNDKNFTVIFLDDIIRCFLSMIFEGYRIEEVCSVKLTRDAELYIEDEFSGNLLEKIKKSLGKRMTGAPCRFLYDTDCSKKLLKFLMESLGLSKDDLVKGARYHNFSDFFRFPHPFIKGLEYSPLNALINRELNSQTNMLDTVFIKDYMLNFPYESFEHVLKFIEAAANDKNVTDIKITLYRVAKNSRVIESLINALNNGKRVTVFSEVKARFDEELNIEYAGLLESHGAKVLYSMPGLKVHAKICQVSRKIEDKQERCCYLSTGNFNENTSKIYADTGIFTADKSINDEVRALFEFLEGRKDDIKFNELLVGQFNMKKEFLSMIDNEIECAKRGIDASIILKLNSLEDKKMIDKLYEASNAGVMIKIIVRGICCLVPGIKNQSENIKVISIVDRFLEHGRIFIFQNGGDIRIFISSADWMKRNLSRRIETAFPVKDAELKRKLLDLIDFQLNDKRKARLVNEEQNNPYVFAGDVSEAGSQAKTYEYLKNIY